MPSGKHTKKRHDYAAYMVHRDAHAAEPAAQTTTEARVQTIVVNWFVDKVARVLCRDGGEVRGWTR